MLAAEDVLLNVEDCMVVVVGDDEQSGGGQARKRQVFKLHASKRTRGASVT